MSAKTWRARHRKADAYVHERGADLGKTGATDRCRRDSDQAGVTWEPWGRCTNRGLRFVQLLHGAHLRRCSLDAEAFLGRVISAADTSTTAPFSNSTVSACLMTFTSRIFPEP
jgi:hypothetical protein